MTFLFLLTVSVVGALKFGLWSARKMVRDIEGDPPEPPLLLETTAGAARVLPDREGWFLMNLSHEVRAKERFGEEYTIYLRIKQIERQASGHESDE